MEVPGHLGGQALTGAAQGDYAFVGQGQFLATVDLREATLRQVADVALSQVPEDLVLAGRWAYFAGGDRFGVVDIAQPVSPTLASTLTLSSRAVQVSGTHAFVAGAAGLTVLSVANPYSPTQVGALAGLDLYKLALVGRYAYALEGPNTPQRKLRIIDVANLAAPVARGSLVIANAQDVFVLGNYAYVPETSNRTLRIVNVADPANPVQVGVFDPRVSGARQWPYKVVVAGSYAYLACSERLFIVNVANPAQPVEAGRLETPGRPEKLQAALPNLYLTASNTAAVFRVINVANPASPSVVKAFRSPALTSWVAGAGDHLYMTSNEGLWIYRAAAQSGAADAPMMQSAPAAAQPSLLGLFPWNLGQITIQGNVLYGANLNDRQSLILIDVSNPYSPTQLAAYPSSLPPHYAPPQLAVQGRYAYLARDQLEVVDVADPRAPRGGGRVALPGFAQDVAVSAAAATMASPAAATLVGIAYVNQTTHARGVQIVDVSVPATPTLVSNVPITGLPTAVWVEGARLYVGSIAQEMPPYAPWRLEVFDITNPAAPVRVAQKDGNRGGIMDLQMSDGLLFAAIWDSGVYVLAPDTLAELAVAPTAHTMQLSVVSHTNVPGTLDAPGACQPLDPPNGASGQVFTNEGYRYFGMTDIQGFGKYGSFFVGYRFPPPSSCGVRGTVQPDAAKAAGCWIKPTFEGCKCGDPESKIKFEAPDECKGWMFTGFSAGNPLPCPANGVADQVANFDPYLYVTGGGTTDLCLSADEAERKNVTALSFQVCASEATNWQLMKLGFQASGNGDDQKEIEKVQLKHRGAAVGGAQTYAGDNGKVSFSFPAIRIAQGMCEPFTLLYDLKALGECTAPKKEFLVKHSLADLSAKPDIGSGLKMGAPAGGVVAACVWNQTTHAGYDAIQPAVDGAQDGHTIAVCPGDYTENVDVTKSLTVKSTKGRGVTYVNATVGKRSRLPGAEEQHHARRFHGERGHGERQGGGLRRIERGGRRGCGHQQCADPQQPLHW